MLMEEFQSNSQELAAFVVSVFVLGVSQYCCEYSFPTLECTSTAQTSLHDADLVASTVGFWPACAISPVRNLRPPHYLPHRQRLFYRLQRCLRIGSLSTQPYRLPILVRLFRILPYYQWRCFHRRHVPA